MAQSLQAGRAAARDTKSRGEDAAHTKTFDRLGRAGIAARGVVYGVIAVLALQVALGDGGKTTNQQGALQTIAQGALGKVLLLLVAIGLAGYAIWRLTRAAIGHGPEAGEDDAKERISGAISGVMYGALCFTAIKILAGSGSSGGGGGAKQATGGVLDWPAGRWIVGIAGLVIIGVGVKEARHGIKKTFLEKSKTEQMDQKVRRTFTRVGQGGHLARAVVFGLIGVFVAKAAIEYDPQEAIGLDGALAKLADAPLGGLALGAVAVGLLAFAVYCVLDTRYRRI